MRKTTLKRLLWIGLAILAALFVWYALIPEWMIVGFHWNR